MQIPRSVEDEVLKRDRRCFLTGLEVPDGRSAYNDRMVVSWIYHPNIAHEVRLTHFVCELFGHTHIHYIQTVPSQKLVSD